MRILATLIVSITAALASAEVTSRGPDDQVTDRLLVVNKLGDTLSIIDPATGKEQHRVAVGTGPHEVAVSPDGRTAVVTNYGRREPGRSLSVIDVATGRAVRTIDLEKYHRPHGIAFLPDGKRIVVTAEAEKKLLIVDIDEAKVLSAIDTDQDVSHMVALTQDSRYAYVPNIGSGSVSIIDLEKKELLKNLPTGDGAEGVAVHPTRPEVWISNRGADTVSVIDTALKEVVKTLESPGFPIRAAISPDGKHALIVNARGSTVFVFDIAQRSRSAEINMEHETKEDEGRMFARAFGDSTIPIGAIFSPDGSRAYVALTRSDVVAVIDTESWTIVDHYATDREPDGLAWSSVVGEMDAGADEAG